MIVVEHEEEIIRSADRLIDIGPEAGRFGGEVVYEGKPGDIQSGNSLTCDYLNGDLSITVPEIRRKWNSYIEIKGARENNLKEINVKFPLNTITAGNRCKWFGKINTCFNNIISGT